MNQPPNILFIQTDQLSALALACYGNKVCKTPNLDQLAAEGVVFEQAICNYPLCSPSRFSMLTGQLASTVGAYDNGCEFPASQPTVAHYLRRLGYQTALSGKMHFVGPDQLHGFEERLTADIYPADFQWSASWGAAEQPDFVTDARIVTQVGPCTSSVQIEYDDLVAFQAQQKLKQIAKGSDSDPRPFFLTVSFTHPHDPFYCPTEHWHRYDDVEIDLPNVPRLDDEAQDPHSYRIIKNSGLLDKHFSADELTQARRGYYGAISYIDDKIGMLRQTLKETQLDQNTVIIFTSDHGEMLGERGLWKKSHFYDPALRVPLIMHGTSLTSNKRVQSHVSLVDLLPTLLSLASPNQPPELIDPPAGQNLISLIETEQPDREVFAEYLGENALAPMLMVRQHQWKYVHSDGYLTLLFNLEEDPFEQNNLAGQGLPIETKMAAIVAEKWDSQTLAKKIVHSQKQRKLVHAALSQGITTSWDLDSTNKQNERWFRGQSNYNDWAFDHLP